MDKIRDFWNCVTRGKREAPDVDQQECSVQCSSSGTSSHSKNRKSKMNKKTLSENENPEIVSVSSHSKELLKAINNNLDDLESDSSSEDERQSQLLTSENNNLIPNVRSIREESKNEKDNVVERGNTDDSDLNEYNLENNLKREEINLGKDDKLSTENINEVPRPESNQTFRNNVSKLFEQEKIYLHNKYKEKLEMVDKGSQTEILENLESEPLENEELERKPLKDQHGLLENKSIKDIRCSTATLVNLQQKQKDPVPGIDSAISTECCHINGENTENESFTCDSETFKICCNVEKTEAVEIDDRLTNKNGSSNSINGNQGLVENMSEIKVKDTLKDYDNELDKTEQAEKNHLEDDQLFKNDLGKQFAAFEDKCPNCSQNNDQFIITNNVLLETTIHIDKTKLEDQADDKDIENKEYNPKSMNETIIDELQNMKYNPTIYMVTQPQPYEYQHNNLTNTDINVATNFEESQSIQSEEVISESLTEVKAYVEPQGEQSIGNITTKSNRILCQEYLFSNDTIENISQNLDVTLNNDYSTVESKDCIEKDIKNEEISPQCEKEVRSNDETLDEMSHINTNKSHEVVSPNIETFRSRIISSSESHNEVKCNRAIEPKNEVENDDEIQREDKLETEITSENKLNQIPCLDNSKNVEDFKKISSNFMKTEEDKNETVKTDEVGSNTQMDTNKSREVAANPSIETSRTRIIRASESHDEVEYNRDIEPRHEIKTSDEMQREEKVETNSTTEDKVNQISSFYYKNFEDSQENVLTDNINTISSNCVKNEAANNEIIQEPQTDEGSFVKDIITFASLVANEQGSNVCEDQRRVKTENSKHEKQIPTNNQIGCCGLASDVTNETVCVGNEPRARDSNKMKFETSNNENEIVKEEGTDHKTCARDSEKCVGAGIIEVYEIKDIETYDQKEDYNKAKVFKPMGVEELPLLECSIVQNESSTNELDDSQEENLFVDSIIQKRDSNIENLLK